MHRWTPRLIIAVVAVLVRAVMVYSFPLTVKHIDSDNGVESNDTAFRLRGVNASERPDAPLNVFGLRGVIARKRPDAPLNVSGLRGVNASERPDEPLNVFGFRGVNVSERPDAPLNVSGFRRVNASERLDVPLNVIDRKLFDFGTVALCTAGCHQGTEAMDTFCKSFSLPAPLDKGCLNAVPADMTAEAIKKCVDWCTSALAR